MAQWERIRDAGLYNIVSSFYSQQFPVEVRAFLAPWLEQNVFSLGLDPDNLEHQTYLMGFKIDMLQQLHHGLNNLTGNDNLTLWYRHHLSQYQGVLEQMDPANIFRQIKYCLVQEQALIANQQIPQNQPSVSGTSAPPINSFLSLKGRIVAANPIKTRETLESMKIIVDDIGVDCERLTGVLGFLNNPMQQPNGVQTREQLTNLSNSLQVEISRKKETFRQDMNHLLYQLTEVIKEIKAIQNEIIEGITDWKFEQRQAANGFPLNKSLDKLEELACTVGTALIELHRQVGEIDRLQRAEMAHTGGLYPEDVFQQQKSLKDQVKDLLKSLICETFVVEIQPPQILRKQVSKIKPAIKLRLLVAKVLNPNVNCQVSATLINEVEAFMHYENPNHVPSRSATLTNHNQTMSLDPKSKSFTVEFNGLSFAAAPRESTKGDQHKSVAEKKSCFYFTSMFPVLEYSFPIETTSIPIVKTCHPTQDPTAWGTILWDNAFGARKRPPFEVPLVVPVTQLMDALDAKFKLVTGKGLSESNKAFLTSKVLRNVPSPEVTWDQFFRDPLPEKVVTKDKKEKKKILTTVSFWEWLFAIMKMCEKTDDPNRQKENQLFQTFWENNKVEGFISLQDAAKKLKVESEKTFMLRFSDSVLGAVTLNYWDQEDKNHVGELKKFLPYTLDKLKQQPLGDRILGNPDIKYLYPNIPKLKAFSKSVLEDDSEIQLLRQKYVIWSMEEVKAKMERERHYSTSSQCSGSTFSTPSRRESSSTNPFTPTSAGSPESSTPSNYTVSNESYSSYRGGLSENPMPDFFTTEFNNIFLALEEAGLTYEPQSDEQMTEDFLYDKNKGE